MRRSRVGQMPADSKWSGILKSLLHMVLVTFIAVACVSCSFFPKRELNGTAEERPKLAQDVLTTLGSVNATLEVLYNSLSRGLNESGQKAVDLFIVEAAAKKTDQQQQAELIKTGLEILVDLKSSRIEPSAFVEATRSLRRTILIFDTPTLRYVQELGRTNIPTSLSIAGELLSTSNVMAKALFTFAVIVERAGVELVDGKYPTLRAETLNKAVAIEEKLLKIQPLIFISLQPHLAAALNRTEAIDPSRNAKFEQTDFTLNTVVNGLALASALQAQRGSGQTVTLRVIDNSFKGWSAAIKQASSDVAGGGSAPPPITIPEKPPSLDAATGALPAGYPDWIFVVVDPPQNGTLDLSKNPPEYKPSANFTNSDAYRIRACQRVVSSYCTDEKLMTVNRPLPPSMVTLKTSKGNLSVFNRSEQLECEAALRGQDQIPIYTWWFQKATATVLTDITARSTTPGRLTLSDVGAGDVVICKAYAESTLGLRSLSPRSSERLVAVNSAPEELSIELPTGKTVYPLEETVQSLSVTSPSESNLREIAKFTVTDSDPNDEAIVSFSDCDGQSPCPFLLATQPTLKKATLYLKSGLNFEVKDKYALKLKAVDKGGLEIEKSVLMNVINQNDPITAVSPALVNVAENGSLSVSQLTSVDEDCGATAACQNTSYTYSFENIDGQTPQDSSFFEIVGRDLKFKSTNAPNYELKSSYNLKIKSIDTTATAGEPADVKSFVQNVTVNITDVNDAPTDLSLTPTRDTDLSYSHFFENDSAGTEIGVFEVIDVDTPSGGFNYAIKTTMGVENVSPASAIGKFEISNSDRKLKIKEMFDFEQWVSVLPKDASNGNKSYFQVTVVASDKINAVLKFEKTFKIFIDDKKEPPTGFTPATAVLHDLLGHTDPKSHVDLVAIDPDTFPQTFNYNIKRIKKNDGPFVNVASVVDNPFILTGQSLSLSRPLDYSGKQERSYTLEISVTDGEDYNSDGNPDEILGLLKIDVSRITLSNTNFDENLPAADTETQRKVIGDFCVDVGDSQSCDTWTYSLKVPVDGLKIIGSKLYRIRPFNFETEPTVNLTVEATQGATKYERAFALTMNDKNDLPTIITFLPGTGIQKKTPADPSVAFEQFYILEQEAANSPVGTFEVADEDANEIMTWDLADSSPDGDQYFAFTKQVNSKFADLRVGASPLPTKASKPNGLKIKMVSYDEEIIPVFKEIQFILVSYPQLSILSSPSADSFFDKQTNTTPLTIDFRIADESNAAVCSLSANGTSAGVFVTGDDPTLIASVASAEKSSSNGTKDCTLTITPLANASGEASLTVGVRWNTALGVKTSTSTLPVKVAFWRPPELNCPSRISLPAGESLSNVPCTVAFSDGSSVGVNPAPAATVANDTCGLTLNLGKLSLASFPSSPCSATVSWSGQNKYASQNFNLTQTLELAPRKFATNGAVKAITTDMSGNVYLGGSFTGVNPVPAAGITSVSIETSAKVDGNGDPVLDGAGQAVFEYKGNRAASCNLSEGFNGIIRAIADAGDGSFWVGGDFTQYRGTTVNYITRLTCSGERVTWYPVGVGFDAPVYSIARSLDDSVFIGGKFATYNGVSAKGVVKLNSVGVRVMNFVSQLPTNSVVNAVALTPATGTSSTPQTIWIGGVFPSYLKASIQDTTFKNLVRVDQTGAIHSSYLGGAFNSDVNALSVVAGGVVVGGKFTTYKGSSAARIVKIDDTGAVDSAGFHQSPGGFNDRVDTLVNNGTSIFAGGAFTSYRGSSKNYLAKIALADGSLQSGTTAVNNPVRALQLIASGTQLLMGGQFTSVGGEAHARLALMDVAAGHVISEFNSGLGFNNTVLALAPFDSGKQALVGGEFSSFGGTASSRLAKFSSTGVFDTTFRTGLGTGQFNGDVEALLSSGSALYVGGSFTQVGTTSLARLAKLNAASGVPVAPGDTPAFDIGSGFNDTVKVIAQGPTGTDIYVGGRFTNYNGNSASRLVRLSSVGSFDSTFSLGSGFSLSSGAAASLNALAFTPADPGDNSYSIFAAGEFDLFKDETAQRLVKLDIDGVAVPDFNISSGANQEVYALALRGNDLFVGGQFTSYAGNTSAQRLARIDAQTGELASGGGYSVNGTVRALAIDSDSTPNANGILVGGSFSAVGSNPTIGPLARLNSLNQLSSTVNSAGTSVVSSLFTSGIYSLSLAMLSGQKVLYTGGVFSMFKNSSAPFALRLDPDNAAEK